MSKMNAVACAVAGQHRNAERHVSLVGAGAEPRGALGLRSSVSVVAILIGALAVYATEAQAADADADATVFGPATIVAGTRSDLTETKVGARGTNAYAPSFLFFWKDQIPSTPGEAGTILNREAVGTIGQAQRSGTAVLLRSVGGAGGNGDGSLAPSSGGIGGAVKLTQAGRIAAGGLAGVPLIALSSVGGEAGASRPRALATAGRGGPVVLVQRGETIGAVAPQTTGTPLIWLLSQGGAGGMAETYSMVTEGVVASGLNAEAGPGAAGGSAKAEVASKVAAVGNNLVGLRVTSQGGAGGVDGVESRSAPTAGAGGSGGQAKVVLSEGAEISTAGENAPALIVESLAGKGGNAAAVTGARGANGGHVDDTVAEPSAHLVNAGKITTRGDAAPAVLIQSIGGDGGAGNAGSGAQGTRGGAGGAGGRVLAQNVGAIETTGIDAVGLLAQSVGGTGGRGGNGGVWGGDGGRAGDGGGVVVENTGHISTAQNGAFAIVAQSVGGGRALDAFRVPELSKIGRGGGDGGNGGFLFFGAGGQGGSGGDGGKVTVRTGGTTETRGERAHGILAQSVGGGGGNGGIAKSAGAFASLTLGGGGGDGGNGGEVRIEAMPTDTQTPSLAKLGSPRPSIMTSGSGSHAIFAQSVGGSGGTGGTADSVSVGAFLSVSVALGGSGGGGGDGGFVDTVNGTALHTRGSEAIGLFAQSVGGGGGYGGDAKAYALSITPPDYFGGAVSVSLGGTGGQGGRGGTVSVANDASIITEGTGAIGLQAMSIGGGGGKGGEAVSITDLVGSKLAVPVTVGGSGDVGGVGGSVTVTNRAEIRTQGQFATGIFAQSVGGGGGDGGGTRTSSKVGVSWSDSVNDLIGNLKLADAVTANVGVGGSGAGGGNGGTVKVTNEHSVITQGPNATAIFAQSVGGGGGSGGGFQGGGEGSLNANVTIGGAAKKGGNGERVEVFNGQNATIATEQDGSHGVFAQSVGGGGGVGGGFTGKQKTVTWDVSAKSLLTLTKELLDVNKAVVARYGSDAEAGKWLEWYTKKGASPQQTVEALKIGTKILKAATDEEPDLLEKMGKIAFVAESTRLKLRFKDKIDAFNKGTMKSGQKVDLPQATLNVAVGGTGGGGGTGGDVTGQNSGTILTRGQTSFGMFLQSVGGGGGAGGGAFADGTSPLNLAITVGGAGDTGGAGGTVKAENFGTIETRGALAFGIIAQSVGGGGGIGGGSANADTLSVSANVTVGGSGGKSSAGGKVEVTNSGTIRTEGREAHAILAQSIGGGGGVFFVNQADAKNRADPKLSVPTDPDMARKLAESSKDLEYVLKRLDLVAPNDATFNKDSTLLPKPAFNANFGGTGTGGGSGGGVTVTQTNRIETTGLGAIGILAQSVGGGGGLGANAGGSGILQIGAGFGGAGGIGGSGGAVVVKLGDGATIQTTGDAATGVFAQSIGGGGGYGGLGEVALLVGAGSIRPVKDEGSSGNGGTIDITVGKTPASSAAIVTSGAAAHAIFAQSLGGGGGTGATPSGAAVATASVKEGRIRAIGNGNTIDITSYGRLVASGENAYAIFAQSGVQKADGTLDSARTGGGIKVEVDGIVSGGKGTGAAIRLDGGLVNTVTVDPRGVVSALSGQAIVGSFGVETVRNQGVVIGDVDLTGGARAGTDSFENGYGGVASAVLRTRPDGVVNLGANGWLKNSGTLDIGGVGTVAHTTLTGNFEQGRTGRLLVDVAPLTGQAQRTSDLLAVSGSVNLGGTVVPHLVGGLLPGRYTFLTAGRIDGAEAAVSGTTIQSGSIPVAWELHRTDAVAGAAASLSLSPRVNFAAPSGVALTEDQKAAAQALQRSWDGGVMGSAGLFAKFLSVDTKTAYAEALADLSQESTQYALTGRALEARAGLKRAMSCPAFEGTGTLLREGTCVWGRVNGSRTSLFSSRDEGGFRQTALSYQIGAQAEFAPDWFVGASAAYTRALQGDSDRITGSVGDAGDVSVALKHQVGPWLFAASGNLGYAWQTNLRSISIGADAGSALARSRSEVLTAGGRLRASYQVLFDDWYIKPYADFDVLYTHTPSYSENGAPGMNLDVRALSKTLGVFSPNVEIGGRLDLAAGRWLRPYGTLGVTLLSDDHFVGVARLQGAGDLGLFATRSRIPDRLGEAGVGFQLGLGNGIELTGEYQTHVGDRFLSHSGNARMQVRF